MILGPIKPIRKPKPKVIEMTGRNYAFLDATSNFQPGDEIFVCVQEEPAVYELLDSGNYTTAEGISIVVVDGVINEII